MGVKHKHAEFKPPLAMAVRLWPTATSGDSEASGTRSGTPNAESAASHPGTTLTDAANGLWARPQARDWRSGAMSPEGHEHRKEHPRGPTLPEQIDRAGLLDQGSRSTSGRRLWQAVEVIARRAQIREGEMRQHGTAPPPGPLRNSGI